MVRSLVAAELFKSVASKLVWQSFYNKYIFDAPIFYAQEQIISGAYVRTVWVPILKLHKRVNVHLQLLALKYNLILLECLQLKSVLKFRLGKRVYTYRKQFAPTKVRKSQSLVELIAHGVSLAGERYRKESKFSWRTIREDGGEKTALTFADHSIVSYLLFPRLIFKPLSLSGHLFRTATLYFIVQFLILIFRNSSRDIFTTVLA